MNGYNSSYLFQYIYFIISASRQIGLLHTDTMNTLGQRHRSLLHLLYSLYPILFVYNHIIEDIP